MESVRKRVEAEIKKIKDADSGPDKWRRTAYERYLEQKPHEKEYAAELGEMTAKIREAARPKAHTFQLEPIK